RTVLRCAAFVAIGLLACPTFPRAETILATGATFGDQTAEGRREETPFVLRLQDGQWSTAALPENATFRLEGAVFSSPSTAWAYGTTADSRAIILQSTDTGRTWKVAEGISDDVLSGRRPVAIAFPSKSFGVLVMVGMTGMGPYLLVTRDGGVSWDDAGGTRFSAFGRYFLTADSAVPELVRVDEYGARCAKLDSLVSTGLQADDLLDPASSSGSLVLGSSAGGGFVHLPELDAEYIAGDDPFWPRAVSAAQDRVWIAGMLTWGGRRPSESAIFQSAGGCGPWQRQETPSEGIAMIEALHLRDKDSGIAGGREQRDAGTGVFLLYTSNGGSPWQRATLPDGLTSKDLTVRSVVRGDDEGGWAVIHDRAGVTTTFLSTSDSGASWKSVPTGFEQNTYVWSLARGSELPE
ncbi:MAG: hypothetical protein AB1725_11540, partial [Armatimonadota bacterium]